MTAHTTFIHLTDLHISDPTVTDDHLYSDTSKTLVAILADVKRWSRPRVSSLRAET